MKYFTKCTTLEDLKAEYRRLAMLHHPDRGGDTEIMKEINIEYYSAFPGFKAVYNATAKNPTNETAESTCNEFYTANGWKGSNYTKSLTLKEIAQIVRSYVKSKFPTYKFSIRTEYASMCQELHVDLKESPVEIYKTFEELTADNKSDLITKMTRNYIFSLTSWYDYELKAEFERIWEKHGNFYKCLNDVTKSVINDVDNFVNSYNYSDCDGMIDYFDVNFYYFGCCQNNGTSVKIVPKIPSQAKPKNKIVKQKSISPDIRVNINPDFNGIEIYFSDKPCEKVRSALKSAGWRWHNIKKCWYNRNTEDNLKQLQEIVE